MDMLPPLSPLSGEQNFYVRTDYYGFTFHQDLRHAAAALRGTSRTTATALLATQAIYRETCCLGGVIMKMGEMARQMCGWPKFPENHPFHRAQRGVQRSVSSFS